MFLDALVEKLHASLSRYPDARNYLHSRLVSDEDINEFKIGYSKIVHAPDEDSADRKRFDDETQKGRKLENKIIFPFTDAIGRMVGLAGRSIDSKEFKTFSTEEAKYTGFFFGLHQALPHIYQSNKVYLVEGYFDLLAFKKVFPNSVATLTAGMNEPQHDLLSFYCDTIVTCFDSDKTGELGTELALKQWKNVRKMSLGYKDPAQCLEILKLKAFKQFVIEKAQQVAPF